MTADRPAFTFSGPFDGQLVATSIHAGHDVRADLARRMVLDEDVRFREEDPFTDRISGRMPSVVRVHRSRFEVDLNRDREGAVYATPDDCWGLVVWEGETLDADAAPCTVNSIVSLAEQGYYDDTSCHRLTTSPGFGVPSARIRPSAGCPGRPAGRRTGCSPAARPG